METNTSNLVKDICESDVYIGKNEEYLVVDKEIYSNLLTSLRKNIIDLLREQNPITEKKLSDLFSTDVHNDLIILNYLGIINIQKISQDPKDSIITLNRNIRVIKDN